MITSLRDKIKNSSIFLSIGMIEQLVFTLWALAANRYMIGISTVLMVFYTTIYMFAVAFALKNKDSLLLCFIYAIGCGVGNWIALILHLIK